MTVDEMRAEALTRARSSASVANYPTIFESFMERGIPEEEIEPRVNVLTYRAWQAVGRQVKRGEHGVQVTTWIPVTSKNDDGTTTTGRRAKTATVFHVTQTEPIK